MRSLKIIKWHCCAISNIDCEDDPNGARDDYNQSYSCSGFNEFCSHENAGVMRGGTLAAPTVTQSYTFDSGDILVPYMVVQGTNQNSAVYLKSVDIKRSPAIDGHSVA